MPVKGIQLFVQIVGEGIMDGMTNIIGVIFAALLIGGIIVSYRR